MEWSSACKCPRASRHAKRSSASLHRMAPTPRTAARRCLQGGPRSPAACELAGAAGGALARCGAHKVMKGAHAFLKGPRHPAAETASTIFSEPWHPGHPAGGVSEWAAQASTRVLAREEGTGGDPMGSRGRGGGRGRRGHVVVGAAQRARQPAGLRGAHAVGVLERRLAARRRALGDPGAGDVQAVGPGPGRVVDAAAGRRRRGRRRRCDEREHRRPKSHGEAAHAKNGSPFSRLAPQIFNDECIGPSTCRVLSEG